MRNIQYVMDTHVLSSAEVAYSRCIKCWTPASTVPVVASTLPACDRPQLWIVYHAEVSVVHSTGYVVQGIKMAVIEVGPPGHGGLYLADAFQGGAIPAAYRGATPCVYGIGWAIYPAASLIAGDVVIFRAKYEVLREGVIR